MIMDLIVEITDVMEEMSPVLPAFNLFNPDAICKDNNTHRVWGIHGGAWWGCHIFEWEVEKKRQPTCHYAEVKVQWSQQLLISQQNHLHRCL